MKCKQAILFKQGRLDERAWKSHAATCVECGKLQAMHEAIAAALVPPAAPAELVDKIFAKTTRRKSWLVRWRAALAGGVAVIAVAVGFVYNLSQPKAFEAPELVAYMQQIGQGEYQTFLSDLTTFEQEF